MAQKGCDRDGSRYTIPKMAHLVLTLKLSRFGVRDYQLI